jgi:2-polyprenyl-3-methyl-5-hydroxy-6-metoxy-1,4-benzoquinol methylase
MGGEQMAVAEIDAAKQEAFGAQLMSMLNGASLTLLASIGHETALFDTLSRMPASTSADVATAAGLDERYVREWLGGMVVGRFVEFDPKTQTYWLPPEHAAFLTREAGTDNLAFFSQYFGLIAGVQEDVVHAFRQGRGVPYSSYPRFQELQAEETTRVFDAALIESIVPLIPKGLERLEAGAEVLNVGCGHGHAINLLAKRFPASTFVGIDISAGGIAAATAEAKSLQLRNARFDVMDATQVHSNYDIIPAFDVIHDLAHPAEVLGVIATSLKDGGTFLMSEVAASGNLEQDSEHPLAATLYAFSVFIA